MVLDTASVAYAWDENVPHTVTYLLGPLQEFISESLETQGFSGPSGARCLDLGSGNGALCRCLHSQGYDIEGIEPSPSGLAVARSHSPDVRFHQATACPADLAKLKLPLCHLVVSTEVIEHVYAPREWAACAFHALHSDGWLICSTPYHGYLKNLLLAAIGKLDNHFTALWDGGHIKFWSRRTLAYVAQAALPGSGNQC